MGQITVKAEAVLEAPSEEVYATIADYRQGHPNMLPKELYDLKVEQGGYGEGTIHRFNRSLMSKFPRRCTPALVYGAWLNASWFR